MPLKPILLVVIQMWSDSEFETLEEKELNLTLEEIAIMILLIGETKTNIENELLRFYRKYGTDDVVTYSDARKHVSSKDRRRRIAVLLLFLTSEFNNLYARLEVKFAELEKKILQSESDFFSIKLPDDFKEIRWGQDDLNWKDRLHNNVNKWKFNCESDLKQALVKAETLEDVLERLDKRFTSMEKITQRLGITESSAVTSNARKQMFKELGAKKYRYYTKADERTCEHCGSMHGLVFPISAYEVGVTAPPIHGHCRCFTIPILE